MRLEELRDEAKECRKCSLWKGRTQVVFGVGNNQADLMFVGEAPGYYEDVQGEPFVGPAGQLLTKMLAAIGLKRADVYITNVLKCRPPNNRDPLPVEVEVCVPFYLNQQIEIIKPKIVSTLGNYATRVMLKKNVSISKVRGQQFKGDGYFIFPIYHPAAILRNANLLPTLETDFQELKKLLEEGVEPPPSEASQMSLF